MKTVETLFNNWNEKYSAYKRNKNKKNKSIEEQMYDMFFYACEKVYGVNDEEIFNKITNE
jgi:hypothetical protein